MKLRHVESGTFQLEPQSEPALVAGITRPTTHCLVAREAHQRRPAASPHAHMPPVSSAMSATTSSVTSFEDNLAKLAKLPLGVSHQIFDTGSTARASGASSAAASLTSAAATPSFYTARISATASSVTNSLNPTPVTTKAAAAVAAQPPVLPAWQSALQVLTHNIPFFLKKPSEAIIGQVRHPESL